MEYRHIKNGIPIFLFAFALLFILLSSTTSYAYSEGFFIYTIEDESIIITDYFGSEETVTVPSSIGGYPVNVIGTGSFIGKGIKELRLPSTIMSIKEGAVDASVKIVYNSDTDKPIISDSDVSGGAVIIDPGSVDPSGDSSDPEDISGPGITVSDPGKSDDEPATPGYFEIPAEVEEAADGLFEVIDVDDDDPDSLSSEGTDVSLLQNGSGESADNLPGSSNTATNPDSIQSGNGYNPKSLIGIIPAIMLIFIAVYCYKKQR